MSRISLLISRIIALQYDVMKTNFFTLLLLVSFTFTTSGQDNMDKILHVWGNEFWGMTPITIDYDGNIYLSGVFSDTVYLNSEDNLLVNIDSTDFFIIKTYPDGTLAWTKVVSGIGSETFHDIEVDLNGNIYIIGQFDHTMDIDEFHYDTEGLFESQWTGDHFLCKLDPDGNLIDIRRGSKNSENLIFRAIELDHSGQLSLIGQTDNNHAFGFQFEPLSQDHRHYMVKLNNSFEAEWTISVCDSANNLYPGVCFYYALVADELNNIYISGYMDSDPSDNTFICKVDQDGGLQWLETIAAPGNIRIRDLYLDKNNDVYMISSGSNILKYSSEGELIWSIGLDSELSTCVVNRDGYTVASLAGDWPTLDGLIIIDPGGEIAYEQTFDNMEIQSLAIDEMGNVYFNGYFQNDITLGGQDVSSLKGANYVFGQMDINEMLSNTYSIHDEQDDTYKLYPNPTTNLLTIETANTSDHYSIEICSLNGQLIYSYIIEGSSTHIDLSPFSKGVYFITVRSKEFVKTEKIVKL